jgi:2-polyprenyl-3-methyl-5-hydroxy-6-metoxy-1,4-benzoquinol methylase
MDFGGGSGIFLPMLCQLFKKVVLLDLHPEQAHVIKDKFSLDNCEIIQTNIFEHSPFHCDAIIAADVLEHFPDTSKIINTLKSFMHDDSALYTSLPTESALYQLLRTVFGIEKPEDHYADAAFIEQVLKAQGLERTHHRRLPIPYLSLTELFSVSAWAR